jgi:putative ABC transport system permease protein
MLSEIRHALRRLRATPLVTLSAIACLSIGVWMTCIVSAVGRGFFRPDLGLYSPEQLVQIDEDGLFVYETSRGRREIQAGRTTSQALLDSLAARRLFAAIGLYGPAGGGIDGEARGRNMTMLSSGMMNVLGVRVSAGRRFGPADDSIGAVIISHRLWRTMYGGDPQVIGRRIRLSRSRGQTFPIVGVMTEGFMFPRSGGNIDAYLSLGAADGSEYWSGRAVLARLRVGTDIDDVRPAVREMAMRLVASDREAFGLWLRKEARSFFSPPRVVAGPVDVKVGRYYTEYVGSQVTSFMLLVIGCGLAVVLIAAANVVNLLLVRGASRRQEIAVRLALGATRPQIVRGLVIETGLVSGVGIAAGFLIAFWQWQLIDASFEARNWLGQIDASTLPIALAAGLILTLIVGVWPGVRATSLSLEQVLRDGRRSGLAASPLDNILGRMVAASTAATVMLLVCARLLGLSARGWVEEYAGPARKTLTSLLTFDEEQSRSRRAALALAALNRLRSTPDVQFAALGAAPTNSEPVTLRAAAEGGAERRLSLVGVYDVSNGYFDAMGIRFLQGRPFSLRETRDSMGSVIVSRSVASALFGAGGTIGRRIRFWSETDSIFHDGVVVGVAEDLVGDRGGGSKQQIYRAFGTLAPARTSALITPQFRAAVDAAAISRALRAVPGLLSSDVTLLGDRSRSSNSLIRYMVIGFTMFALVGIVLAAIGTYGIVAYSVARRTHEIGVRIALGAQQQNVTWMIVEQGLKITAVGIAFGLLLSYWSTRVLGSVLMGVRTDYVIAMTAVVALMLAISGVACWIPGYRAGRLNPVDALRAE